MWVVSLAPKHPPTQTPASTFGPLFVEREGQAGFALFAVLLHLTPQSKRKEKPQLSVSEDINQSFIGALIFPSFHSTQEKYLFCTRQLRTGFPIISDSDTSGTWSRCAWGRWLPETLMHWARASWTRTPHYPAMWI